jgi:hypothetical protein
MVGHRQGRYRISALVRKLLLLSTHWRNVPRPFALRRTFARTFWNHNKCQRAPLKRYKTGASRWLNYFGITLKVNSWCFQVSPSLTSTADQKPSSAIRLPFGSSKVIHQFPLHHILSGARTSTVVGSAWTQCSMTWTFLNRSPK